MYLCLGSHTYSFEKNFLSLSVFFQVPQTGCPVSFNQKQEGTSRWHWVVRRGFLPPGGGGGGVLCNQTLACIVLGLKSS